jgi:hypothetical protein
MSWPLRTVTVLPTRITLSQSGQLPSIISVTRTGRRSHRLSTGLAIVLVFVLGIVIVIRS